jgi:capsular exopolysaccharide synthesis family protein
MDNLVRLVSQERSGSPITEAYRSLRTNIQFCFPEGDMKVILATSAQPGEGKSTVTSNLAIVMAQSNKKVLLIDCDLRKPKIHTIFGLINKKGLTNALVEGIDYHTLLQSSGIEGITILTAGAKTPRPTEILGSPKMVEIIDELKTEFDVILLDTSPIIPVTDAAVLSRCADGIVLVVEYGRVNYNILQRAKDLLEMGGTRVLGVVFNKIPKFSGQYYYYYYYGSRSSSEKKGKTSKRRKGKDIANI